MSSRSAPPPESAACPAHRCWRCTPGLKTHRHMALGAEVIDLIRLHLLDDPNQIGAVGEVSIVKNQARVALVEVLVKVINSTGVEAARAPLDAVHLITLLKQQLS